MSDSKENPHLNPGKVYYDDYIFKVEILSFLAILEMVKEKSDRNF